MSLARNDSTLILTALSVILSASKGLQGGTIGEDHSGKHPREVCDGLHLRIVAHLDDLHIVRTECDRDSASYRHHLPCAERKHQQKTADQREKQIACRTFSSKKKVVDGIGPISLETVDGSCSRHSSEHRIGPCSGVVRIGLIVGDGLIGHTLP